MPLGCSVVTGVPAGNSHGMATAVPPGKGTVFVTATLMTVLTLSRFWTVYEHENEAPGGSVEGQVLVIPTPTVARGPVPLLLGARVVVVVVRDVWVA